LPGDDLNFVYDSAKQLYIEKQYKRSLELFLQSAHSPDIELRAKSLNNGGLCFIHLQQYDSAINFLKKSLTLKNQLFDTLGMIKTNINIGKTYLMRGWNTMAYEHYKNMINKFAHNMTSEMEGNIFNNLGIASVKLAKYNEAMAAYQEAMNYFKKSGLKTKQANVWLNAGNVYEQLGKKSLALSAYDSAIVLYYEPR